MTDPATAALDAPLLSSVEERADPAWGAVVSLALGVFGLVTAEFLPASLLTPMAHDLASVKVRPVRPLPPPRSSVPSLRLPWRSSPAVSTARS